MACTYTRIVEHIQGERVNDEFEDADTLVWTAPVIRKAIREALATIYALRPDLFAEDKELTLEPDKCVQAFCEDCERVLGVHTVDGDSCNEIEEREDEDAKRSLDFMDCYYADCTAELCQSDKYDPGTWDQMENNPCQIRFENPPPTDRAVTAVVSCVPVDVLEQETLPQRVCSEFFQIVVDNTLFRLYSIDHKDGNALHIADRHWRSYAETMAKKFGVDYSLMEDDYLLDRRRINGD